MSSCPPGEFRYKLDHDCYKCSPCPPGAEKYQECLDAGLPAYESCMFDPRLRITPATETPTALLTTAKDVPSQDNLYMTLILAVGIPVVLLAFSLLLILKFNAIRTKLKNICRLTRRPQQCTDVEMEGQSHPLQPNSDATTQ